MVALAAIEAVALDLIARADASYACLRSCSIFLSQVSRMEPCPSCDNRPEDCRSTIGASAGGTFRKSSVNFGSE